MKTKPVVVVISPGGTTMRTISYNESFITITNGDYEDGPYFLAFPSYGSPRTGGYVPSEVYRFLDDNPAPAGIIGVGNRTFGEDFCKGADLMGYALQIPVVSRVDVALTLENQDEILAAWEEVENDTVPDRAGDPSRGSAFDTPR